jgi:hypothetical protein
MAFQNHFRFAILSLSLALPGLAAAAHDAKLELACPDPAEFERHILRCGQNENVAAQATFCAYAIADSWNSATSRILPSLRNLGKNGNQNAAEADSKQAYKSALLSIEQQIGLMQFYTARLEQYPFAMIDLSGSKGEEDSLSCFNSAFHQVQETINFLDDEIIRAKKTYETTADMMDSSASRQVALADSLGGNLSLSKKRVEVRAGKSLLSESAITGNLNTERLHSLAATEKLRTRYPKAAAKFLHGKPKDLNDAANSLVFSDSLDHRASTRSSLSAEWPEASKETKKKRTQKWAVDGLPVTDNKIKGSIGSILWRDTGENSVSGKLLVTDFETRNAQIPAGQKSDSHSPGSASPLVASVSSIASPLSSEQVLPDPVLSNLLDRQLASSEVDLFAQVKQRYRETEQFRSGR